MFVKNLLWKVYDPVGSMTWRASGSLEHLARRVETKIKNKLHLDKEQIVAAILALRMFGLVVLFSLMPFNTPSQAEAPASKPVYVSLNTQSANPVLGYKPADIKIVVGESNFERSKQQLVATSRVVFVRERASEGQPTEFRAIYKAAGAKYAVPWQIIEAVHQVESGKSGSASKRSYAGATGPLQFMPGTWRTYGVDGDGDGRADITNVVDAIYGAAHYLATSGASSGDIRGALLAYNHSTSYVNKVLDVAYSIGF